MWDSALVLACLAWAGQGARVRSNRSAEKSKSPGATRSAHTMLWSSSPTAAFSPAARGGNAAHAKHIGLGHYLSAARFRNTHMNEPDLLKALTFDLSRRQFVKGGTVTAAALALPWASASAASVAAPPVPSVKWTEVPGIGPLNRQYFVATLANGIRALVTRDEQADIGEMVLTVGCGSLADPPEFEGLAHLSEHVTGITDPAGLQKYLDKTFEGVSDLNAATGEITTSYEVTWLQSAEEDELDSPVRTKAVYEQTFIQLAERFAELIQRSLSNDPAEAAPTSVISAEMKMVDGELDEIKLSKPQPAIEVAALKARTPQSSVWRPLHRGDKKSMPFDTDSQVQALSDAVTRFRVENYSPEIMTLVVTSSLPLEVLGRVINKAFSKIKSKATAKSYEPTSDSRPLFAVSPFSNATTIAPPASAVKWDYKETILSLSWNVEFNNLKSERLQKPLALIGHVLESVHERSLATLLREQGLSPLAIENEDIIRCKSQARADEWVLWTVEIVLVPEAAKRWREALALAVAAVARLAETGVPEKTVSEVKTMVSTRWKYNSRAPSSFELANDLLLQLPTELSVTGPRIFVGNPTELANAASSTLKQLSAKFPTVTVWAPNLGPLGVEAGAVGPALQYPFNKLAKLVPLQMPAPDGKLLDKSLSPAEVWTQAYLKTDLLSTQLMPPPPNPWVPKTFLLKPANPMKSVAYRIMVDGSEASGGSEFATVQLSGCVRDEQLNLVEGDQQALADVYGRCQERGPETVFGTAILQLESPFLDKAEQVGRAELWKMTLLNAIIEQTQAAALAGMKTEITINKRGMRLLVTGFSQLIPSFMAVLLQRTLAHVPPDVGPELAAARRVGIYRTKTSRNLINRFDVLGVKFMVDEISRATSDELQSEMKQFFKSVKTARLLMAGALDRDDADALAATARKQLEPMLQLGNAKPKVSSTATELKQFSRLLYYVDYSASEFSRTICLDPAMLETVSQCKGDPFV